MVAPSIFTKSYAERQEPWGIVPQRAAGDAARSGKTHKQQFLTQKPGQAGQGYAEIYRKCARIAAGPFAAVPSPPGLCGFGQLGRIFMRSPFLLSCMQPGL